MSDGIWITGTPSQLHWYDQSWRSAATFSASASAASASSAAMRAADARLAASNSARSSVMAPSLPGARRAVCAHPLHVQVGEAGVALRDHDRQSGPLDAEAGSSQRTPAAAAGAYGVEMRYSSSVSSSSVRKPCASPGGT